MFSTYGIVKDVWWNPVRFVGNFQKEVIWWVHLSVIAMVCGLILLISSMGNSTIVKPPDQCSRVGCGEILEEIAIQKVLLILAVVFWKTSSVKHMNWLLQLDLVVDNINEEWPQ